MTNLSIIVPIYNEQEILATQVNRLISQISNLKYKYEIILVENGSIDNTYKIAVRLAEQFQTIKLIRIKHPCYGNAFKEGIKKSVFETIVQFDIDFWDMNFLQEALKLLDKNDIIVGSKNLANSNDQRPFFRKLISKIIEIVIRFYFRVNLTDTHGMKVIKKRKIIHLINKIRSDNHFFDTELLIKCFYLGYKFKELPVSLKEIRRTRFAYHIRFKEVLFEIIQLIKNKNNLLKNASLPQ